jgi:iron complex transport system substrate-binding protein
MSTRTVELLHADTTRSIIASFRNVYRALGYGHREKIYSLAMERDLRAKGHKVEREFSVMVYFCGDPLARETIDMVVDDKVVVENKSRERLRPGDHDQLRSYLCATFLEVGLLLHFGPRPAFYRSVFENRYKAHGRDMGPEW